MQAVILAGGRGRRLAPYSLVLPKPLMPMGEIPILAVLVKQLRHAGVDNVVISLGYLGELIQAYFRDGAKFGVKLHYITEDTPLGTAGALALIPPEVLEPDFLMMNGDVLTDLDFGTFFRRHKEGGGIASISTYARKVKVEYGVLDTDDGGYMTAYTEKPELSYRVSMGVYAFRREVLRYVPAGQALDVPDLMRTLMGKGERILTVPYAGEWIDIGNPGEYQRAQEEFARKRALFLPGDPLGAEETTSDA